MRRDGALFFSPRAYPVTVLELVAGAPAPIHRRRARAAPFTTAYLFGGRQLIVTVLGLVGGALPRAGERLRRRR